ncbi:MAG: antitoxin [Elusimicrobia bacterium GWC2_65_9]|nr:MAG: antitoxin [Elusimicrobia bacterium GWA2_66_18]OGR70856.1 MAG: antitoxin [Elusimicrobia bacterium GWC2_65_9]
MLQINVHDAKTRFSKILARVQAGETVVIAKSGRPVARIVAFQTREACQRRFGTAKKTVHLSAGWNAPLPGKVLDAFEP